MQILPGERKVGTRLVDGGQMSQDIAGIVQGGRPEEYPSGANQQEREGHVQKIGNGRQFDIPRRQQFAEAIKAVEQAPDDKGPVGTMPKAADKKNDSDIQAAPP